MAVSKDTLRLVVYVSRKRDAALHADIVAHGRPAQRIKDLAARNLMQMTSCDGNSGQDSVVSAGPRSRIAVRDGGADANDVQPRREEFQRPACSQIRF
jgi:hypothetical protein